ncbi:DUF3159 domain-containing protein [Arcanobacterium buesumense]|uniref:DUF3159 domain-containing protein n=1 Tax=Arcanobacterium buesumense TaxID=2722751 RepID=A0A6H2EJF3_9ACTO|nr:DUF3159 domain-containing protein [Arcanobacterium buesumense]QJC21695.1 DUF3159 domain-containing protein [Arcanobacterium buesumense]
MTNKRSSLAVITAADFDAMQAVGGLRGIIESIVPTVVFLVIFAIYGNIGIAAGISLGAAALAIAGRLISRVDPSPALGGLGAVVISALMAWRTGQAADFFVWGLVVNVGYLAALLISIVVRWPLLGVLIAMLRGEGRTWRHTKSTLKRYYAITWMWAGLFAVRAAVQLPLYFAGATNALGIAKLVMGVPFFALVCWLSWLMIRNLAPVVDQQPEDPQILEQK